MEFIIPGPLVVSLLHSGIKAQVFGLSISHIAPGFEVYYVKFIHNHLDIHNSYNTTIACVYSGIAKVGTGRTQAQQFSLVSKQPLTIHDFLSACYFQLLRLRNWYTLIAIDDPYICTLSQMI